MAELIQLAEMNSLRLEDLSLLACICYGDQRTAVYLALNPEIAAGFASRIFVIASSLANGFDLLNYFILRVKMRIVPFKYYSSECDSLFLLLQ